MRTFVMTILSVMVTGILACNANNKVKGDGNVITKEIRISDYEEIEIGSGIESSNFSFTKKSSKSPCVNYTQESGNATLSITIDNNLLSLLKINSEGKTLWIGTERGTQIAPSQLVINTNSKELRKVTTSGCIDFYAKSNLSTDNLEFKISGASDVILEKNAKITNQCKIGVSGAGDLKAKQINCDYIECRVSGSGDAEFKGSANNGSYRVSGSGDIKAYDFIVKRLECSVSGSGDIKANASESIKASASGSGDVKYKGNAKVNKRTSGSGDISKAGD